MVDRVDLDLKQGEVNVHLTHDAGHDVSRSIMIIVPPHWGHIQRAERSRQRRRAA